MSIVTDGLGGNSALITDGYGDFVSVIPTIINPLNPGINNISGITEMRNLSGDSEMNNISGITEMRVVKN